MNFLNFRLGHGQAGSQGKNRLRQVKRSVKIRHLEFFEGELEKRELLATTSFSSGMLSINLNAAGEILTLTNDGSKINISSTAAITGSGSSFVTSGVNGLNVTNSGSLAGQSFNFGVGSTFSFSQGVTISGVGSVLVNNPINVTGTATISATGANTIKTSGSLSTAGGALTLKATSDIVITQPILTNGGVQTLTADSDADGNGTLSLNFAIAQLQDPRPNAGNQFGASTLVLPSGNVVVTSPYDDAGGTDAGAVYLFNGFTGQLISTLTGFTPNDNIGSGGVVALTNGNYVVTSLSWDNGSATDAGAVTWGNGTTGVSGTVNSTNSFVGNSASDQIGSGGVTALANGNYVVISPYWDNASIKDVGAATWGNGTAGLIGRISSTNSLIGGNANDQVGSGGVTALTNGNYVVISRKWTNFGGFVEAGAVTWGNGLTGISGNVSPANSFVGFYSYNWIGLGGVTALTNGNYVICSPREAGYVTWGNGFTGIIGTVSTTNSLCGNGDHQVGSGGVKALTNGNYVVCSPNWDNGSVVNAGAVTWGNGLTGISGSISTANSLVGTRASDMAGSSGVTALTNGNYVVLSPYLDNGSYRDAGAVTWGNGLTGISGSISTSNSLVGTRNLDMVGYGGPTGVTALTNGNYVVNSPWWGLGGAVTWGNGLTGISGVISSTNSLVSTVLHDDIGAGGVTALTNGNYVFSSPYWDNGSVVDTGSVTWCNGLTGMSGSINSTNSLVGTVANDRIGYDGVKALTNGNYVVCSPNWSMNVGAITWGNGSTGIKGGVSTTNSLTGNVANDFSGSRVTAFSGGNYVVVSPLWNNGSVADAGAVTWANGTTSIIGKVSTTNSAVGNSASSGLIEYASCFFGLNSFFVSLTKDGSGRILSGSQSSGFSQTSGSLNSGGGAIALQGNLVSLQNSINTSTANSIAITANNINIAVNGTLNASASGNVSIRTRGVSVNLGNGTDTASSLGLSQDELNKITAGTLTIGSNTTGSISLTNNLTWSSNLVLSSNTTINGTLSNANHVFSQGSNNITAVGKISIAGVALAIAISAGNNQSTTVGTDFATLLKVQVIDYIGNPVPNVTVTFTVNANGASGNFASTTAVKTDSTGYATAPKLTANTVSGVYTVTASAAGLSPLTFTLTNSPGAATSIAIVDGNNQSATVGTTFAKSLQVIAKDTYGNHVPGVSVIFTAPSTGASGTFAKSSIVTTNSSGVAASPQFTANTVTGVYAVTAAIIGLSGVTFILTNSAGTVSTLAILDGNNQSALIGNAFTKPMQVVAKDSYGNLVPGLSVTFTAPSTGASGTFATSSTVTTNISGVAVSPVFTANTIAGTYSITASSTGSTTQNFSLINLPGVATKLAIVTGNNQTATVGNSFAITLQVLATDNFGNGVPGVQILYTAPSSGASGSFMGSNLVTTNNQGIAVSNPFTANSLAGNYIVTATSPGLSTQSFSLTNSTSGAIISITGGSNQSATVGTAFGSALQVKFTDSFGNPVPGVSVTFSSPATGPGITFGGAATVVSNALGFATSPAITANGKAGSFTVTASVTNVGSANFTLTNTAGAAATIVTKSGNNQTATVNTAFGSPLIARVLDSYGNPVSGCSVTFSNPGAGAMAVFGGSNVVTSNADGMAASPPLSANTVSGAYIVTASAANVSALQFALNNAAGLPASIVKTGGNNQGATANTAFTSPLSVKVSDIYGNPVPNVNIAFSGPLTGSGLVFAGASTVSTNAQGIAATPTITANSVAGTYNVQAYVNDQVAALFTLTNLAGMAKKLLMTGGNNQAATVNMAFATPIQMLVTDAYANPVSGVLVNFNSPSQGPGVVVTGSSSATSNATGLVNWSSFVANKIAGSYTVTASISGVDSLNFALTNTPGAAAIATVTAGSNQSIAVNGNFSSSLQLKVTDSFGNPVSNVPVTFATPTSGASGKFNGSTSINSNLDGIVDSPSLTANTVAGDYLVTATVIGVGQSSFNLTNLAGTPAQLAKIAGNNQAAQVTMAFANPLQVKITDAWGNSVANAPVLFTVPFSGAGAALASTSPVTTNAQGIAISPVITSNTVAGNFSVNVSANGNLNHSFSLINLPGVAAKLAIASGDALFAMVNTAYTKGLQVLVTDAYNNPVPNVPVTFNAPNSGAGIVLAGGNVVNTNTSGNALLDGFTANKVSGTFTVTAGVPNIPTVSFNLNNKPGAVGSLVAVAGSGQSTVINGAFPSPMQVKVLDVYGNILPNVPVTFNSPGSGAALTFATNSTSLSDSNGLVASPPMKANGVIGSYIATASTPGVSDLKLTMTNAAPTVQSVVIQQGAVGRSFIRYVDLTINDLGTVASIISSMSGKTQRISLTNTGLAGKAKTAVALKGFVTTNGNQIHIDFGSKGLGGNAASNAADGAYLIALDLDGNGSLETTQRFWRLLGDVNGDKVVDAKDTVVVNTNLNKSGVNIPGDTNGDGKVNSTDVTYVKNAQKRKITV